MLKKGGIWTPNKELAVEERKLIRWPAEESAIFEEDWSLLGRTLDWDLDDYFGQKVIGYGSMAASKTLYMLAEIGPLTTFKDEGYQVFFFMPSMWKGKKEGESRIFGGLKYGGEVTYVSNSREMEESIYSRKKKRNQAVIIIDEVQMFDSGIIGLVEKLRQEGNFVIMNGIDLNFRGRYFQLADKESGETMEDLIATFSPDCRFPRTAKCAYQLGASACGRRTRFSQRLIINKTNQEVPAPVYDPLVMTRKERDELGIKHSYEPRCGEHLEVPYSTLPEFLMAVVNLKAIPQEDLLSRAQSRGIAPDVVKSALKTMLYEKWLYERDKKLYMRACING